MFARILVAIDGSPPSDHGLAVALGVAREQHAELCALHVVDETLVLRGMIGAEHGAPTYLDDMLDELKRNGSRLLAKADSAAAAAGLTIRSLLVETRGRSVADTIVAEARKLRAELIVMGTHGRRGWRRLVMGSDAEGVLREARVPVLLVRGAANARASRNVAPARLQRRAQRAPARPPAP
jgi:nucleotide-binding universal stress UspA family protein